MLKTLSYSPDIQILPCFSNPDYVSVITPNNEDDSLILMGLSLMLLRLSKSPLPEGCYRISSLTDSFYNGINQTGGDVDRLYRLDLISSLSTIPINLILKTVSPLVGGDGSSVYRLISDFLHLPIIDGHGNDSTNHIRRKDCMQHAGEITRVLFHIVLAEVFDREFSIRFPKVAFTRLLSEVFIPTRYYEEVLNEDAVYALLEDLGLEGDVESIEPGEGSFLSIYNYTISLSNERKVQARRQGGGVMGAQ